MEERLHMLTQQSIDAMNENENDNGNGVPDDEENSADYFEVSE